MSQEETKGKNKKSKEGLLPKMEILIILVFFISFVVWAMSKCSSTQKEYEQKEAKQMEQPVMEKTEKVTPKEKLSIKPPSKKSKTEKVTVLYVVLEDLKLRKGHSLDSAIIKTLKMNDEVYFLNEVTEFKQEINLGDRMATEPWIKVRAYTGHEGWVYGAGINYYKSKKVDRVD